ncbi:MAG: hypothetical protein EGQ20_08750 [Bacteroides oleiciplenus]|nr:hypothetical protein [Bacteroides oleiciplenus]
MPIAFTACQNEEFVKDYSQELKNRGEIDVILSASYPKVGNSVDTRMDATEDGMNLKFLWEQGTDKLGAAMMDEVTPGTVNGAKTYVNNPFIAQGSGETSEFASPSGMPEGIYLFYNSYKDILNREALSLSLQPQEFDPANTNKTSAQQMVKYMNMVAPMVNLNSGIKLADAAAFNLNLEFVNLYTPVRLKVMFKNAKPGTKLTKISINKTGSNFDLGGDLNATILAGGGQNTNVLSLTAEKKNIDEAKLAVAKKAVDAIVQVGANNAGGVYKDNGNKVTGAAELTIKDGMELENDKEAFFWILIPRGHYESFDVTVETTNGSMTETRAIPSESDQQDFTEQTRKIVTTPLDFGEAGNVTVPKAFTINNTTDWDNAIQYIQSNASAYMGDAATLTIGSEPIYITSIPTDIAFTLAGTNNPDSKLIFGDKDGKPVDIALNLKRITMDTYTHLEVGEGANVTINNAHAGTLASLTNNGTLTMKAIGTITALTNNSTLNFDAAAALVVPTVDNNAGATINVKSATTFTAFKNKVADEKDAAKIVVAEGASLDLQANTNAGIIVNKGELKNATGFTNNGTVDNHGTLTVTSSWTNNGTIIARDGGVSNNVGIAGTGTIEVMNVSTYPKSDKAYVKGSNTENAVVTNHADYDAAKTADMKVTLDGGEWTIVDNSNTPTEDSRDLKATADAYDLNLKGNLNVKVNADWSAKDIVVSGTSTITVADGVTLKVKSLTVNKDATATIAGDGKVEIKDASTVTVNGTLTNNGKLVTTTVANISSDLGSEAKKFNITIAKGATLINNGTIGGEVNTQVAITANGSLTNMKDATIYGTKDISNAESYSNKGTIQTYPKIVTDATDLSSNFTGATDIKATAAVTAIPTGKDVKIEFTTAASPGLELNDGDYGELTFSIAGSTISAGTGQTNVAIEKIILNAALTAGGSVNFVCNAMEGRGTLTNSGGYLKKAGGITPWAWPE